jgi:endonuclease I
MKISKTFCLFMAFILAGTVANAQGPNNSGTYYKNANGKSGAALKTALHNIISQKNNLSYDALWEKYKITDTRADGHVRDWYSNTTNFNHITDKAGSYSKEGDVYNREHSVPQSWGSPKADIVHVVPTDGYINNMRGNDPFGEVDTSKSYKHSNNDYSKSGMSKTAGYSGKVFEPNDELKGDFARIYFYMATCYEGQAENWSGVAFGGTKYQPLSTWTFNMMMRWSKLDPVDDVERARNNAVARQDVQNNRNPFVDYPGLEDYIWGEKKDQAFSYDHYDNGGTPVVETVSQPTFTPEEGRYVNQVVVSMSTTTEGATIYYTTNNADATPQGRAYSEPITLTSTTTLKAIAVKDGVSSFQTVATYTIESDSPGGEEPVEGLIALNSEFFGVSYNGSITKSDNQDLVGTQNGVTIVYALGEGGENRYCNDQQIRLYKNNKLTISTSQGNLSELEFQLARETSKTLFASTGTISDLTWRGNAQQVVFNVDNGSGNMQLSGVKVKLSGLTGINTLENDNSRTQQDAVYTLSGQKVERRPMKPGLYLSNGKKFVVR